MTRSAPTRPPTGLPCTVALPGARAGTDTYPTGQTVDRGRVWQGQTIQIRGVDAPKACAYSPRHL